MNYSPRDILGDHSENVLPEVKAIPLRIGAQKNIPRNISVSYDCYLRDKGTHLFTIVSQCARDTDRTWQKDLSLSGSSTRQQRGKSA